MHVLIDTLNRCYRPLRLVLALADTAMYPAVYQKHSTVLETPVKSLVRHLSGLAIRQLSVSGGEGPRRGLDERFGSWQ